MFSVRNLEKALARAALHLKLLSNEIPAHPALNYGYRGASARRRIATHLLLCTGIALPRTDFSILASTKERPACFCVVGLFTHCRNAVEPVQVESVNVNDQHRASTVALLGQDSTARPQQSFRSVVGVIQRPTQTNHQITIVFAGSLLDHFRAQGRP